MKTMILLIFAVQIGLVLSRPIGKEAEEKHEALLGDEEIDNLI